MSAQRGHKTIRIDLTGQRFGSLVVLSYQETIKGIARWLCQCDCGQQSVVYGLHLRAGCTQSCGCRGGRRTHGKRGSRTYSVWRHMKSRCQNPNNIGYRHYGGRGIRVCERWQTFENFYADMGDKPIGKSLDRMDNNGDYTPENCRWATPEEQQQNRRDNVTATYAGERLCLAEWARRLGVASDALRYRAGRASPDEAVARSVWLAMQEDV